MSIAKILTFILLIFFTSSCVFKADEVKLKGFDRGSFSRGGSEDPVETEVTDVTLENDQLTVTGIHLDSVTAITLDNEPLSIVSQSANQLILTSSHILNLALNTAMDLVFTNAYGQSVTSVQFNLVDGAVTTVKIADDAVTTDKINDGAVTASKLSDMSAGIGQVLKFNGTTWVPGDLSSLTYAGNWDASVNNPNLSGGGNLGEFYIVSNAGSFDLLGGTGTNSWAVGDWAVWNNVVGQWEKIDNATNVQSFNGRSGAVTSATNDYSWAQIDKSASAIGDIADVDLSVAATVGQVLKFDGTNWIASDDLSSGGAGSVSSSEIADGAIVNADISAAAAIDQSKINGLTALASSVATNTSNISTNTSAITSNDTDIANNASSISSNASNISANTTAIGTKANSAITLSAGNGLSGGGDLSANRTFDVNVDGTSIEIVGDALQVKDVADTKLTTSCSDGEVLSASSGRYVCAASTAIGNWTLNTTDLYYNLGNVGIGTSTPATKLHVIGGALLGDTSLQNAAFASIENEANLVSLNLIDDSSIRSSAVGAYSLFKPTVNNSKTSIGNVTITYADIPSGVTSTGSLYGNYTIASRNRYSGNTDDGVLTNLYGMRVQYGHEMGSASTPETTNAFGLRIFPTAYSGTITNMYDLFLGNSAGSGTVSTHFALYQQSATTKNYFASPVGIGVSSPSEMLDVSGVVKATSFEGDGSALTNVAAASVVATAGSAATPSISFGGDTNTGFYSGTADTIEVSVGGTNIFDMSASGLVSSTTGGGVVTSANGTASNPTFSFNGDEDTGWYSPGVNELAAATGGGERVRINSLGYVGIGESSPAYSLHVRSQTPVVFDRASTSPSHLLLRSANGTVGAETAILNGDQLGALSFTGHNGVGYITDAQTGIKVYATEDWSLGNNGARMQFLTTPNGSSSQTTRMTIAQDGNVGIGTATPGSKLHVMGEVWSFDDGNDTRILIGDNGTDGNWGGLDWDSSSDFLQIIHSGYDSNNGIINILNTGNVGIGTTTPQGKLDVSGTIKQNGKPIGGSSGVPTFKAVQNFIASNAGWPAHLSNFTISEVFDSTGSYDPSTGVFTAPIEGYYSFSFSISASQATTSNLNDIGLSYNATNDQSIFPVQTNTFSTAGVWNNWSYSGIIYLNVSDTVSLNKQCCTGSGSVNEWRGMFSGYYLHP